MFEEYKGKEIGIKDHQGEDIKEGQTVRWMTEDGDCYKGVVEYGEPKDEGSMFLAGFGVFSTVNITDEVMDDDCSTKDDWSGELEIVKPN